MSANKQTNKAMSEEMALEEFYGFLSKHKRKPGTKEDVKEDYSSCIDAMVSGNLTFENGLPVYSLLDPVKSGESGDLLYDKITFKTRIKPTAMEDLMRGVDAKKDVIKMGNIMMSHICGLATRAELDLFGKLDYEVMRDISAVFT